MQHVFLKRLLTIFIFAVITFIFTISSHADNIQHIKANMKARLPAINNLKKQGVVGEDNRGFLAFTGSSRQGADIVAAENGDRDKVYKAIAAKTGASPVVVGKRRAKKIAEISRSGFWIQAPSGKWYRK